MKIRNFLIFALSLILGLGGGAVGFVYQTLPQTEEVAVKEETFYSYSNVNNVSTAQLTGAADELSIHFLELGNKYTGDCTYIKFGSIDILIDCGSKTTSIPTVENYLKSYMTDNILEYVIVTHAHTDHYAGFATNNKTNGIFDLFECQNIIDFGVSTNQTGTTYQNYVNKRTAEINLGANYYPVNDYELGNNKIFTLDSEHELTLEILYNEYNHGLHATTENDNSVCTLLRYGEKSYLFTGDLEEHGESLLVENNPNLPTSVDLFKAGHHGSKTSSNDCLLDRVNPKMVCVCCCAGSHEYTKNENNQFPTQAFISRLAARNITQVYVTTMCVDWDKNEFTSMNGNIVIISYSTTNNLSINCSNNTTILKDTEWFKNNRVWE